ncbi:MAG: hypothetical protein LBB29_03375 [Holosporaceae bacterium]|jgi:hypothetical protein|nr:hypothetical protein [Holosporaceae bacterium]
MKNTKRQIQDRLKKAKEAQRPGEHSDAIAETIKEEENRLKNIETEIKEQEKHLKSLLEKIKEDKKEAIKTQSKKENIWKRLYRKFSRNNDDERGIFLKSASGMAYFFREKLVEGMQDASQKSEALLLLRHVRKDLERLEKMYLLTDNESKKSKGFVNKSATATIVEAEVAGNVQFNNQVTEFSTVYRHAEKSPILTENGEFVIVRATVPSATSGQLGRRFLETNSFKSLLSYLDKNKIEREPTDQESNSDKLADYMRVLGADVGNVISSEIGRVLSNTGGIGGSSIGGIISGGIGASSDHEWIYKIIEKPKIESDKALPIIDELIPFKKRIVIDYMLSTGKNIVKAGLGTPKFGLPIPFIGASISNANGKVEKRTGSDTLHDMFGKYNSMSLGIIDTDTPITSINLLLANQSHQLLKMFQSIGERNVQSNVLFELQEVYNNLLRLENLDSSAITELFRQFITDCVTIAPLAEAYDNAEESEKDRLAEEIGVKNNNGLLANLVRSFRDICQEQYIHIFKPYYENAFQYIFPK